MQITSTKYRKIFLILILLIGLSIYLYWENNHINITSSEYVNPKIPATFDGFVIARVSDLHNKTFGEKQKYILAKLKSVEPDIIVVTGDIIDRRRVDLAVAIEFVKGAAKIAPVYYVTGNHEAWSEQFDITKAWLIESGVIFMDDKTVTLTKGVDSIHLMGISDPDFLTTEYAQGTNVTQATLQLAKWTEVQDFRILLTHRPELFKLYSANQMDLIFAGHAHGGQIRLPLIGGVVAPDQGLLPKFTSGSYVRDASTMYVSKGLGNSIFPIRINDGPEIVVVTLRKQLLTAYAKPMIYYHIATLME